MEKFPAEFEKIYQYIYDNYINDFEKEGKSLKKRCYILLIGFIIILLIGKHATEESNAILSLVFLILFGIISFYGKKILQEYGNYKQRYKDNVVPKFIKLINNQLQYGKIDSKIKQIEIDYNNVNFDDRIYNQFYGDDYIEGYLDNKTYLKLADISVEKKLKKFGDNRYKRVIFFEGIFAFFNYNKENLSRIRICKNELGMIKNNYEKKIQINNSEFEDVFDIFAEDKNIAIKILTPEIRKILLDFSKINKFDFEVLLTNNIVYFRFFTGSIFETKISKNPIDKEILYIEYSILKFIEKFNQKINE